MIYIFIIKDKKSYNLNYYYKRKKLFIIKIFIIKDKIIIFIITVEPEELKRVIAALNTLYNDKIKANKPAKGKKKNTNKIFLEKTNAVSNGICLNLIFV